MGLFERFPYTNFHELNATWMVEELVKLKTTIEQFVSINALKYADPIQWNITSQYESNTIVIDPLTGTAYISVQPVPSGVDLTRTEYWTVVFDLSALATRIAQNFTDRYEADNTTVATFASSIGDWIVWGDVLYKAITNIAVGETYTVGYNIEHFTIEDLYDMYFDRYNSVADMKSDLHLNINDYVQTMGYYEVGDNGGAIYKIVDTAPSTPYESLDNGLYAQIINIKYIEQIGAKHDGTTDVLPYINTFLTNHYPIDLIPGKSYFISNTIALSYGDIFNGNGALLICDAGSHFTISGGYAESVIKNVHLKHGAANTFAINVNKPNCILENIDFNGDGNFIKINTNGYGTALKHCIYTGDPLATYANNRTGVEVDCIGGMITLDNCSFTVCSDGVLITQGTNVIIRNTNIATCKASQFSLLSQCDAIKIIDGRAIIIDSCYIEDCDIAVYCNGGTIKNVSLLNTFINLLSTGAICVRLVNTNLFRAEGCFFKSAVSPSYAISIDSTSSGISLINNTNETDRYYAGSQSSIFIVDDGIRSNKLIIQELTSNNETLTYGGVFTNTSLSSGDTQTLNISMPANSILKFIAHTSLSVHINASGLNATKSLTITDACVTVMRLPNNTYVCF